MAQNKETRIWQDLKNLDKDWHFTRIESSTVNGIPDVHCVVNKQVFWLELKANTSKNCGLSKYQINWHIKYLKAGGKAYILNRPLLQAPYELLAVSRESRTPLPLSRHTDLKTLITFASQLAAGPVNQGSWFPRPRSHAPVSQHFWTLILWPKELGPRLRSCSPTPVPTPTLHSTKKLKLWEASPAGIWRCWSGDGRLVQGVGMVYFHFPFSTHAPVSHSEANLLFWTKPSGAGQSAAGSVGS